MSTIIPFTFPETGPAIYAVRFSNDVVKVGYSARPLSRLRVHDRAARQMGIQIVQAWASEPHENARKNERLLIDFCAANAPRVTGEGAGEYFAGIDFGDVVEYASSLCCELVAPAHPQPAVKTCAACDTVHDRPLTAQGLLHQVAHGELRIIDRFGRDVSAAWAGAKPATCSAALEGGAR
ncbi:hypothetical protein ABZ883_14560 [Streptomyces sp. NPDC046977]|uniref:hypothetical protein n=1 Tax=Streptomyces sp. NPDC046977 TaxID=3154703 RepID=UPI0033F26A55